jgi:hypothetical protein
MSEWGSEEFDLFRNWKFLDFCTVLPRFEAAQSW